ncbi:hypothetical protein WA577_001987, partial [Blastocystis sp. JDR]
MKAKRIVFENLPSLKTIQIAEKVSSIEPSMNPAVDHCPFDFNVLLIMKNLLHLSTLDIARSSLSYCSAIELKNVTTPSVLRFFPPLLYLTTLNTENAEGLEAIIRSKSPWCGYGLSLPLLPQPSTVESLYIADGTGNQVDFSVLDLSALPRLKT